MEDAPTQPRFHGLARYYGAGWLEQPVLLPRRLERCIRGAIVVGALSLCIADAIVRGGYPWLITLNLFVTISMLLLCRRGIGALSETIARRLSSSSLMNPHGPPALAPASEIPVPVRRLIEAARRALALLAEGVEAAAAVKAIPVVARDVEASRESTAWLRERGINLDALRQLESNDDPRMLDRTHVQARAIEQMERLLDQYRPGRRSCAPGANPGRRGRSPPGPGFKQPRTR